MGRDRVTVAHQHKIGHLLVPYLEIQWPGHVPHSPRQIPTCITLSLVIRRNTMQQLLWVWSFTHCRQSSHVHSSSLTSSMTDGWSCGRLSAVVCRPEMTGCWQRVHVSSCRCVMALKFFIKPSNPAISVFSSSAFTSSYSQHTYVHLASDHAAEF